MKILVILMVSLFLMKQGFKKRGMTQSALENSIVALSEKSKTARLVFSRRMRHPTVMLCLISSCLSQKNGFLKTMPSEDTNVSYQKMSHLIPNPNLRSKCLMGL